MSDNIDEVVAKAISEFASARKLGEDMVRAILAYKGCDTDCSSATFEGWKHYDDIEDIIDEQFDVDDEIDNIISEYEEEGEEEPDEDEIRAIAYERLNDDLMFNFDVIELCDYLEDGDGYLVKPQ